MAKYVVHKLGFFYTDEEFMVAEGEKFNVVAITSSLDEANEIKRKADIVSLKKLEGTSIGDWAFGKLDDDDTKQMLGDIMGEDYLSKNPRDYYYDAPFPSKFSEEQAEKFLRKLDLTFHCVVEYSDDTEIKPKDFKIKRNDDLGVF